MKEITSLERQIRLRASFSTQANALARKNFALQKRKWSANLCLLSAPFLICCLLYALEEIINKQLNADSFRCGCKCLACCDWVPVRNESGTAFVRECYNATAERPCSPYSSCSLHNETECGYLFSTADQVGFCEVRQPPLWPALLQIPRDQYRGPKYPEIQPDAIPNTRVPPDASPMLYTGDSPATAARFMEAMWGRSLSITDAAMQAYIRAQAAGYNLPSSTENQTISSEQDFVDAAGSLTRGLYEFGLVMGTSAFTSLTLLMEPAFVATTSGSSEGVASRPPLYFAQKNCSELSEADADTLAQVGQAITNMTGFPVQCASLPPVRQASVAEMNDQVFCGWLSSGCAYRAGSTVQLTPAQLTQATHNVQEFASLYHWHDSDAFHLNVSVWVNNTNVARDPGVPDVQRWSQPVNLAANAYLRSLAGPAASIKLAGVRDMPRGPTRLSLDFSSLLGPLFMMWFMQLLLPVNVFTLVHEKEQHLRIMQRMQGLGEGVYYVVQYCWMMAMYCVFMVVFVAFGSAIGLKIFTLNSYTVQAVFYLLWGNLLASFSFYFAALQREARPAVLLAVIYVIITGFVANLVLVQYVEQGPRIVADLLQLLPAFGLFRGLYELSQYAFLADRTGGTGLTWEKLLDPGCGMLQIWMYFLLQWLLLPVLALYIEQVSGAGSGIKKHPLFFLGYTLEGGLQRPSSKEAATDSASQAKSQPFRRRWWPWWTPRTRQAQGDAGSTSLDAGGAAPTPDAADGMPAGPQSPLDYYYGSFACAAGSPQLRAALPEAAAISPASGAAPPLAEGAASLPSAARKTTSVKLSMADEAGSSAVPNTDDGADVLAERAKVEDMWCRWLSDSSQLPPAAIMLHHLRKVYPTRNGNPPKVAVHDLSLGIERCECFGLLGPNGAGKTTTLRMMEGFLDPSSGFAVIEGYSIGADMDSIYSMMGACPQHDLLWQGLSGREHLLFYGRIKNLSGITLHRAVDDGLRSVNLFSVGDDLVSTYSGGMKRRLSVAIALMGDPLVVYLDEPSTGLDPSSRRLLWDVIKKARLDKAVVLTTHSMEEAEALCDRLGIFVGGRLRCVGNPKDLTARFGGYLTFTMTTPAHQEAAALAVVRSMSPSARMVYSLGGTQKFELPLGEVEVEAIFRRMEEVKLRSEVELLDWGVSNATLEEVFIRIAREAGVEMDAFT